MKTSTIMLMIKQNCMQVLSELVKRAELSLVKQRTALPKVRLSVVPTKILIWSCLTQSIGRF